MVKRLIIGSLVGSAILMSLLLAAICLANSLTPDEILKAKDNALIKALRRFDAHAQYDHAEILLNQSMDEITGEILCQSIAYYDKAVRLSPYVMKYRLRLHTLESLAWNRELSCLTNKIATLNDLVEWAISNEPNRLSTLKLGSDFFLNMGDKIRCLELMRQSQELQEQGSPAQAKFALALVSNADELQAALPQKYPQISPWLKDFRVRIPNMSKAWNKIIDYALQSALEDIKMRWGKKKFPAIRLKAAAEELYPYALLLNSNKSRRMLDFLLAESNAELGERQAAIFFKRKAVLNEIPTLLAVFRGHSFDDQLSKMIFSWKSPSANMSAKLDTPRQNLGIFNLNSRKIHTIILSSINRYSGLPYNRIQVFHSPDNSTFEELETGYSMTDYRVENRQHIVITFKDPPEKFIKLVYIENQTHYQFSNTLYSLIRAFEKDEENMSPW